MRALVFLIEDPLLSALALLTAVSRHCSWQAMGLHRHWFGVSPAQPAATTAHVAAASMAFSHSPAASAACSWSVAPFDDGCAILPELYLYCSCVLPAGRAGLVG